MAGNVNIGKDQLELWLSKLMTMNGKCRLYMAGNVDIGKQT